MSKRVPLGWPAFLSTTIVLIGAIALHAAWMPVALLAAIAATLALRVSLRRRRSRPERAILRLLLLAALLAGVYFSLGNLLGREAGSALLSALLVLKLLETDTRRDARLIVTVSCFLAMCSFLFQQSPLQVAFACIVVVLALATLVQLQSLASRDMADRRWRAFDSDVMAGAGRLALWSVPFAAACFLFFPRLGAPLWGAPGDTFTGRTGISDTMEPGALSSLALDDTPAMRVSFQGAMPAKADRYWRGLVLWWFDGRTWAGSGAYQGFRDEPSVEARGETYQYDVMLEPTDQRWLFMLDAPLSVPAGATMGGDIQVRWRQPVRDVLGYHGVSSSRYVMQRELGSTQRYMALSLPRGGNPRARALAATWRDAGLDARAIARRGLAMIDNSFIYTLEPPLLARDSIDDFLFSTRAGYCEHYASAFTYLMRAAGVPARVVIGYQGGQYNAAGDYLTIRRADAHAWSEIWVENEGWVRIDPTAEISPANIADDALSAMEDDADAGWLRSLHERWDLVGFWWNRAVVEFGQIRQQRLLQQFGIDRATPAQLIGLMAVGATLAIALAGWGLSRRRVRQRADGPLAAWRRLCGRLARLGVARQPSEGPRDFAVRAASALPEFAPALDSVSQRFVMLRYAAVNDADNGDALARFEREARSLERALSRRYGRRARP